MATRAAADPVSTHLLDRAIEYQEALTKAVEWETATIGLDKVDMGLYRSFRRVSMHNVEDCLKAATWLKDALEMTDAEWVEAWRKAGARRLETIAALSALGDAYLPDRVTTEKASFAETKASIDRVFSAGLTLIAAIAKETKA